MNAAWGYAGMALTVASLPFKHWTNYEAQITRHTIEDAAWQGRGRLRIALVSDFHDGDGIWSGRALARLVRKEQVDLICITGDLFTPDRDGREALAFLDDVCEWRPIYFVTGNHDEGMPQAELLKARISRIFGVHVLDNRKVRVRVKEAGWRSSACAIARLMRAGCLALGGAAAFDGNGAAGGGLSHFALPPSGADGAV